jgi:hypothetical protein
VAFERCFDPLSSSGSKRYEDENISPYPHLKAFLLLSKYVTTLGVAWAFGTRLKTGIFSYINPPHSVSKNCVTVLEMNVKMGGEIRQHSTQ